MNSKGLSRNIKLVEIVGQRCTGEFIFTRIPLAKQIVNPVKISYVLTIKVMQIKNIKNIKYRNYKHVPINIQ